MGTFFSHGSAWRDRLCVGTAWLQIAYGGAVVAGWILHVPVWRWMTVMLVPAIGTGIAVLLCGAALLAWRRGTIHSVRTGRMIGLLIALLGIAFLLESLTGIDLYVDLPALHTWYADKNPWPGRSSPNTAVGMLLAGMALWLPADDFIAKHLRSMLAAALFAKAILSIAMVTGTPNPSDVYSWTIPIQFGGSTWYRLSIMHPLLAVFFGLHAVNLLWLSELRQRGPDLAEESSSLRISDIFFGVALLLLLTVAMGSYGSLKDLRSNFLAADENYQRQIALEELFINYSRAEAVWTRVLVQVTPTADELAIFAAAERNVAAQVQRLRAVIHENSERFNQLDEAHALLQEDFAFMRRTLQRKLDGGLRNDADIVAAIQASRSQAILALHQLETMRDAESARLAQRRTISLSSMTAAAATLTFGSMAGFAVLSLALLVLLKTQKQQAALETGLRRANEDLETRVLERTQAVLTANRQLETVNATLEQRVEERTTALAERTADLEDFSYSVSHDLRAPLRAIDGYAFILEEDHATQLEGPGSQLVRKIRSQTKRMGELVDNLLRLSKFGRHALVESKIDMTRTAREAWQEIQHDLRGRGVAHAPELQLKTLPAALGDAELLRHVWVNLIDNAVKYSSRVEHPVIVVDAMQDAEEIVYSIRDNGVGFDMRYADKLFGVFERLHDQSVFSGTGVGLAIVSKIIRRHGGRVWAQSAPDQGATFYFSLPCRELATPTETAA